MVGRNSENPVPKIGAVLPSKEVPLLSPVANHEKEREEGLREFINLMPDYPDFFHVVYHHTMINLEEIQFALKSQGETRYAGNTVSFPDPISMLNLLATMTKKSQLFTAVMIAPQMQTATLAQQIVAITNASRGRFNFGAGVGWNPKEYDAAGVGYRFDKRGWILDQQLAALEMLLSGKAVNLKIQTEFGEDARENTSEIMNNMLLNPGAYYTVPIWVGGFKNVSRERAAKFADGYMPLGDVDHFEINLENLLGYLEKYGRDVEKFQTMGRVALGKIPSDKWVDNFIEWQRLGVSHIALTTTVDEKDEAAKNSDPWHHRKLISQFSSATDWLRNPNNSFSDLFSDRPRWEAPEEIVKQITEKEKNEQNKLYTIQLKLNVKPKHVIMYLESKGFAKFQIEGAANFPMHSEQQYHFIEGLQNKKGEKVTILQENSDGQNFILAYDSKIEMGLRKR